MEKKPDHVLLLLQQLQADDPLASRQAETEIRAVEDCPPSLVEGLINIIRQPENDLALQRRTISLLSDIKFSTLVPLLGNAIEEEQQPEPLAQLLSIAWQNRLDFSSNLLLFAQHAASQHLTVAIEAATAFEIAAEHANTEMLRDAIQHLKQSQKEALPPHAASIVAEMLSQASTLLQQKINAEREANQ